MARPPHMDLAVLTRLQSNIGPLLDKIKFFEGMEFNWITIQIEYGLVNDSEPRMERIDKRYLDLPMTMQIDIRTILKMNEDQLYQYFLGVLEICLVHVAMKYGIDDSDLRSGLWKLRTPPYLA